jgi:hypothetical protein
LRKKAGFTINIDGLQIPRDVCTTNNAEEPPALYFSKRGNIWQIRERMSSGFQMFQNRLIKKWVSFGINYTTDVGEDMHNLRFHRKKIGNG